jgi:hypothetical protein
LAGGNQSFNAMATARHGQNTTAMEPESRTVDALTPGGFIGEQFSVERSLRQGRPRDGHGASVSFKEKEGSIGRIVGELQGENVIRDQPDSQSIAQLDTPAERFA